MEDDFIQNIHDNLYFLLHLNTFLDLTDTSKQNYNIPSRTLNIWRTNVIKLFQIIEKLQNQNQEYVKALEEWINGERVSFYCIHKKEIQNIIHNLNNDIDYWRSDCLRDLENLLK